MDFKREFFPLLNKAFYKINTDVHHDKMTISDVYLLNRYLSFYHPMMAFLSNEFNKIIKDTSFINSGKYVYEVMDSIIPRLNKQYIQYISKKKSKLTSNANKFVIDYSRKHNISEKEVWDMLYTVDEINSNLK